MRLIVADCEVEYDGRLGARLARAPRLVMCKADGSVAVHSDAKAYKPLNWMTPPCTVTETDDGLVVRNKHGEELRITIHEVLSDHTTELGEDPGLEKEGVEKELQALIADRVQLLRHDLELVRREYPTDIGPVDLLCRDGDGGTVAVEIKRVGEIAGVEQLLRYRERLERDPSLAPVRAMYVAPEIKPQARVFAESRNIDCVEVDLDTLRGTDDGSLRLF